MEHLFHVFGGGCGEHLMIPALSSAGLALVMFRHWIAAKCRRLFRRAQK